MSDGALQGQFVRFTALPPKGRKASAPGIFVLAYELRDDPRLEPADSDQLEDILVWFRKNLRVPPRFSKKNGRAHDAHNVRGVSWFRPTAIEHLAMIRDLAALLERHDHFVEQISASKIGYVVYEDDYQVVAEPFADVR
jgi:hypothetical protein